MGKFLKYSPVYCFTVFVSSALTAVKIAKIASKFQYVYADGHFEGLCLFLVTYLVWVIIHCIFQSYYKIVQTSLACILNEWSNLSGKIILGIF